MFVVSTRCDLMHCLLFLVCCIVCLNNVFVFPLPTHLLREALTTLGAYLPCRSEVLNFDWLNRLDVMCVRVVSCGVGEI